MDQQILQYGFGGFIAYYVIKELFKLIRAFMAKKEETPEDKFVLQKDCIPAMRRVGGDIDDANGTIKEHNHAITKIQKSLIYLVEKQGGDAAKMGLYE